jgi:hypothetical protein
MAPRATRFIRTNRLITTPGGVATLINGNGAYSGAPAKSETAAYPMTNLLLPDRYAVWQTGTSPPSPHVVLWDLTGASSASGSGDLLIKMVGILNLHKTAAFPTSCVVYMRTDSQGWTAFNPGTWTAIATLGLGFEASRAAPRNVGLELSNGAGQNMRFLAFSFNAITNAFTLGNCMASATVSDLGLMYSPGAEYTMRRRRIRERTIGGIPIVTEVGDWGRELSMQFTNIDTSTRDKVRTVFDEGGYEGPMLLMDPFGALHHYLLLDDALTEVHAFSDGTNDRWNVDVRLELLP